MRICEFCNKEFAIRGDSDNTVCKVCDAELIAVEQELAKAEANSGRKCRLCQGPLPTSRYFACPKCVKPSDMASEDIVTEQADYMGWTGDDEPAYRFNDRTWEEQ